MSDDEFPVKRRGKRRLKVTEPCVPSGQREDTAEPPLKSSRGRGRLRRQAPTEEDKENIAADEELVQSASGPEPHPRETKKKEESEEAEEDADADEELARSMLRSGVSMAEPQPTRRITRSMSQQTAASKPRAFVEKEDSEEEEDDEADQELAQSMLKTGVSKSKSSRPQGRNSRRPKAATQLAALNPIIFAGEVPWPARKKAPSKTAITTGDDDEDSEVERALRQEELLQRMRKSVEKGRLRMQQSSADVDVRAVKEAALAPRLSFDWPSQDDSKEDDGDLLEVLPPEDVCPRQLLKEQLDYQRQRELAKGLVVAA